jgi:hypothetical protein
MRTCRRPRFLPEGFLLADRLTRLVCADRGGVPPVLRAVVFGLSDGVNNSATSLGRSENLSSLVYLTAPAMIRASPIGPTLTAQVIWLRRLGRVLRPS